MGGDKVKAEVNKKKTKLQIMNEIELIFEYISKVSKPLVK